MKDKIFLIAILVAAISVLIGFIGKLYLAYVCANMSFVCNCLGII